MINKASLLKFLRTILIALAGLLSLTCQDQNSALTGRNKESAIAATLKWARLAPFPVGGQGGSEIRGADRSDVRDVSISAV
jgi:hypothetical protein